MPSLSDFGLVPEEHEERRARRRFDDESGARPLPSEPTSPEYADYDDEVELPVERSRAGLFGVGVGIGVAALAVMGGLYFGGYLDRPTLNPAQEAIPLAADSSRFDEWVNDEALARARVADRNLSLAHAAPVLTEIESPDIRVLEEDLRAPHPVPSTPMPALPEPDQANPRPVPPELKAPQMPLAPGESVPERERLPAPAQPTAPAETAPPDNPY